MFKYTLAALEKVKNDVLTVLYWINTISMISYIAYLGSAIYQGSGNTIINIILLVVTLVYYGMILVLDRNVERKTKKVKKKVQQAYGYFKLIMKAVTLGITVYGIYMLTTEINIFTIASTLLMAAGWILQVLFEIIKILVAREIDYIVQGFLIDIEPITNTVNFVKKLSGKEIEPSHIKEEVKTKLTNAIEYKKEKIRIAKEELKEQKRATKLALKEQKRNEKLEKKNKNKVKEIELKENEKVSIK